MKFEKKSIPDVIRVVPTVHVDARGFFMETWQSRQFADGGIEVNFVQDNFSSSSRGTLRGLHYQVERPQGKLVRVVRGRVFDVAVDLRRSSKYFGKWVGEELSAENKHQLWVPPGFAHGFLVLSESADFEYKCSDFYAPEHERCIRWDDPDIGIEWPNDAGVHPVLSEKDAAAPSLSQADTYA